MPRLSEITLFIIDSADKSSVTEKTCQLTWKFTFFFSVTDDFLVKSIMNRVISDNLGIK